MSRMAGIFLVRTSRFPRVSGDEPDECPRRRELMKFSPRERG